MTKFQWRNFWMHKEGVWLDMPGVTDEISANRFLTAFMPQCESGAKIRRTNDEAEINFYPGKENK